MKDLVVFHREREVGVLRDDAGSMSFSYAPSWLARADAFPISVSLPLDRGDQPGPTSFFANLLPEGAVRSALCERLGLSPDNDFGLLAKVGGECAGALTLLPTGQSPNSAESRYDPLDEDALRRLAAGFGGLASFDMRRARLSLAGAQDKLPVRVDGARISVPRGNSPSTHILKLPNRRYRHLVDNEAFSGLLVKAVGLEAATMARLQAGSAALLLVTRYDRLRNGTGGIVRLHQEDFCQALEASPSRKYEEEGGPSFADCYRMLIHASSQPVLDARRLLQWLMLNVLCGNADGHAKNLSLLHRSDGTRLAPFYDVLCTSLYPRLDRRLAMSIGGQRDPNQLARSHWLALAEEIGVTRRYLLSLLSETIAVTEGVLEQTQARYRARFGQSAAAERIARLVKKQLRRNRGMLARG